MSSQRKVIGSAVWHPEPPQPSKKVEILQEQGPDHVLMRDPNPPAVAFVVARADLTDIEMFTN